MQRNPPENPIISTKKMWYIFIVIGILLGAMYWNGFIRLEEVWERKPDYSHGYLIPIMSLFMVWTRRHEISSLPITGIWAAPVFLGLGLLLYLVGEVYSFQTIVRYSFLFVLIGIIASIIGWAGLRRLAAPLLMLLLMFPLPGNIYSNLSSELQALSSQLGVFLIRLFGISVYLEGNVIDLGIYKLEVVEACSGLRYLFPLLSIGLISAFFFRANIWLRILVFFSTIPIAIIMNGVRIGITGFIVEHMGINAAEGFMHDFEGWLIFMACVGLLIVEIWAISKVAGLGHFSDVFVLGSRHDANAENGKMHVDKLPKTFLAVIPLLFITLAVAQIVPERGSIVPPRMSFAKFPMDIGEWSGKRNQLEKIYLDVLEPTDYLLADYLDANRHKVNFYVAYYASSTKGEYLHSPRGCIPSGGWTVSSEDYVTFDDIKISGYPVTVTRNQIHRGDFRQLVYYWVQQGGRPTSGNSQIAGIYRLWDGIVRNRTDNALIRLVTPVDINESWKDADRRLVKFMKSISSLLPQYVPG